jgi:hypothetical protein
MPARGRHDSAGPLQQALTLQKFREQRRCFGVFWLLREDFFEEQTRRLDLAVLPERLRRAKARVDVMTDMAGIGRILDSGPRDTTFPGCEASRNTSGLRRAAQGPSGRDLELHRYASEVELADRIERVGSVFPFNALP